MYKKFLSLALLLVMVLGIFAPLAKADGTLVINMDTSDTNHYYQRHTWYSQGRFWIFYSDGGNAVYQSSLDGITWTVKATAISNVILSQRCDSVLASDGITINLVGNRPVLGQEVVYIQGVCQSAGDIHFTAQQTFGYPHTECSIEIGRASCRERV